MQQTTLTSQFDEAILYTHQIHAGQVRRKTGMPRIAHLLIVAGTVLEHGGSEAEAIGALLHDAVEDAGGYVRLDEIQQRFGESIRAIVLGCSHPGKIPGMAYLERKKAYVQHLEAGSASVHLVAAADKLHNARALLRDYLAEGESLWERYRGGRDGTLWYYQSLVRALFKAPPGLLAELQAVVNQIQGAAARPTQQNAPSPEAVRTTAPPTSDSLGSPDAGT